MNIYTFLSLAMKKPEMDASLEMRVIIFLNVGNKFTKKQQPQTNQSTNQGNRTKQKQ